MTDPGVERVGGRIGNRVVRRLTHFGLAWLLVVGASTAPASAATAGFKLDLGTRSDFVAQTNFVQCVGASMQMMLNMIQPGADRTAATQRRLQDLARKWSPVRPDGRERNGASVRGWATGLNLLGAGPYRLVGITTLEEALLTAAQAMRRNALVSGSQVTSAFVEDPLYPHGSTVWGPSPAPGAELTPDELGRQFVPRRASTRWGMAGLSGKYVLVLPYLVDLPTKHLS